MTGSATSRFRENDDSFEVEYEAFRGGDFGDEDDLGEEDSFASPRAAGARVPNGRAGRQAAADGGRGFNAGGRGPPRGRGGGFAVMGRVPPPPNASSLKALPAEGVQRFLKLVQEGDYAEALKALRKVRRAVRGRGCSKEAFGGMRMLLHHLLEGYASANRLTEALEVLGDMNKGQEARLVSAAAFNAVLRGLLARGLLDQARFVVREEMPRLGATPNENSLNLLMDCAARAGSTDEAWDILEEMQRRGLRADKYTVSILTKGIFDKGCDKRRAARGITLVETFLSSQSADVDEVLINSLLDVFCRMGDMVRLEATLQKMKEYGIKGSAVTYGTIVKAYGRANIIDKVVQAWEEMSAVGLEANAVTYGCMLDACVKCGHIEKALHVFSVMKQSNLHKNTILYATLIKGFAKNKDVAGARDLYREMVSEGVVRNVVVFNSLIDACVRAGDLHAAAEVLQEMTAANVRPDLITFSTLIKGYCSSGELSKAMRLAEELQARNLECDEIVYNSLLEGCVKAGDLQLGLRLFTDMKTRGVRPSSVTFSILVKLLSRAGRLDLASHLVATEMREMHGVMPTRMVWSCLVTCCVKSRDLSRAVSVLEHLDREGPAAGGGCGSRSSMYATVIEGCLVHSEAATALQLCDRAYKMAPLEEASRGVGILSADLLRRVFEAAGGRGGEGGEEARLVLASLAPRVGEQARASLEEALERGSWGRRGRHGLGAGGGSPPNLRTDTGALDYASSSSTTLAASSLGFLAASASSPAQASTASWSPGADGQALGGALGAAGWPGAGAWPSPNPYGAGGFESAAAASGQWDAIAANAAAAVAANPWAWQQSMDAYSATLASAYAGYGLGAAGYPQDYASAFGPLGLGAAPGAFGMPPWAPMPPWDGQGQWAAMPGLDALGSPGSVEETLRAASTPGPASASKALDQTPPTTAGMRSPGDCGRLVEDDDEASSTPLQTKLFANEPGSAYGRGEGDDARAEGEVGAVSLEGPPGLC